MSISLWRCDNYKKKNQQLFLFCNAKQTGLGAIYEDWVSVWYRRRPHQPSRSKGSKSVHKQKQIKVGGQCFVADKHYLAGQDWDLSHYNTSPRDLHRGQTKNICFVHKQINSNLLAAVDADSLAFVTSTVLNSRCTRCHPINSTGSIRHWTRPLTHQ